MNNDKTAVGNVCVGSGVVTVAIASILATFASSFGATAASTIGFTEPNAAISIRPDYGITNVTAQMGTNAYLPCKVKIVFNKSVSWVRVRDDHILTVDRTTFIADERFHAYHSTENNNGQQQSSSSSSASASASASSSSSSQSSRQKVGSQAGTSQAASATSTSGPWTLQIRYVQPRDSGIYECQISAEPKISAQVHLHVVVPKTEPIGDTVRYVKEGSRVALHCVVSGAIDPPLYVIWYHGQHQIFADNGRQWKTEISHQLQHNDDVGEAKASHLSPRKTIGSLIIPAIKKKDSGNYTCDPSNSPNVTIVLHVINGEYSASAITSSSSSGCDYQQKSFNRFLNILCVGITLIYLLITT